MQIPPLLKIEGFFLTYKANITLLPNLYKGSINKINEANFIFEQRHHSPKENRRLRTTMCKM